MKKYVLDLVVSSNVRLNDSFVLLKLTDERPLPDMLPGQFAELKVEGSASTFLRRPISINFVDRVRNELWLLIQLVGDGTRRLGDLVPGDRLNCVLPLGNCFSVPEVCEGFRPLLVGGGAGTAPLLMLGERLAERGARPVFLLGARSEDCLLETELFERYGELFVTTEDGSRGERGFVTAHSVLSQRVFDFVYCCGPRPMMEAVARYAAARGIETEVSLENRMACGLGACLCCVEKTREGHKCVCTDGPVFNVKELLWQI